MTREERFIVIKRKHLSFETEVALREYLKSNGISTCECVVVEKKWSPIIYESVYDMILNKEYHEKES